MCQNAMGPLTREGAAWTAAVGYGGAEGSHPPDSCNRRFPPVYRASHNCKPLEGRPLRNRVVCVVAVMAVEGCQDGRTPAGPDREARVQADAGPASTAEVIPGQYIVVLKPTAQDVSAIARDLVAAHGGTLRFTYTHALQGFSAQLSDAAAAVLAQHPLVAYVEPNQMMHAITDQLNPPSWGLDRVDEHDLPLDNVYTYNATGAGVKVYIIDTGIRKTHVDFGGRAITGVDEITPGGTADDCNGHGTHGCESLVSELRLLRRPLWTRREHHARLEQLGRRDQHDQRYVDGCATRRRSRGTVSAGPPERPAGRGGTGDQERGDAEQDHGQSVRNAEPATLHEGLQRRTSTVAPGGA